MTEMALLIHERAMTNTILKNMENVYRQSRLSTGSTWRASRGSRTGIADADRDAAAAGADTEAAEAEARIEGALVSCGGCSTPMREEEAERTVVSEGFDWASSGARRGERYGRIQALLCRKTTLDG